VVRELQPRRVPRTPDAHRDRDDANEARILEPQPYIDMLPDAPPEPESGDAAAEPVRRDLFAAHADVASSDAGHARNERELSDGSDGLERSFSASSGISSPSSGPNTPRLSVSVLHDIDSEPGIAAEAAARADADPNAAQRESRFIAQPPVLRRQHADALQAMHIDQAGHVASVLTPQHAALGAAPVPAAPARAARASAQLYTAGADAGLTRRGSSSSIAMPHPCTEDEPDANPHADPVVQRKRERDRETIHDLLECCICKELRPEQLIEYPCGQHTSCLACAIQSNSFNQSRYQNVPISHFAHVLPESVTEVHHLKCFACRSSSTPYCFTDSVRFVDASMCALLAQALRVHSFQCWGCNFAFHSLEDARRHIVQCWPSWWPCMASDSSQRPCSATRMRNPRHHSMFECRTYSCAECLHSDPRGVCVDKPLDTVLRHLRSGQPHSPARRAFTLTVSRPRAQ
jgi:hypothetical protein